MEKLLVFTDLDGTLLDHDTYDYTAAQPALRMLKDKAIPLILASSKTGAELAEFRSALSLQAWPAIVENGAGELAPGDDPVFDPREYLEIRSILKHLPASMRQWFRGFGDMSLEQLTASTGLPAGSARLAQRRAFTEPGLFSGNEIEKQRFIAELDRHGISAKDGGRFLTLSFGRTKADGLYSISKRLCATHTIALGDAPNDRDMLLAATQAVIVRNDHAPEIGEVPGALRTELAGPAGWNKALLGLLQSRVN